ncbi:MAG: UDP-glucose--hexose-1-phosphate uridylyltransferase [Clostridia bacterium]|nr:UDP-glucose--hexose-1-phosphate uridylyltransferase [Clostridia bacterium]
MHKIEPAYEIERLLKFGQHWGLLGKWDIVPVRNAILDLLQIFEPFEGNVDEKVDNCPAGILNNLLDYAFQTGLLKENSITYRDLLDTKIMGLMMPGQSQLIRNFYDTVREKSVRAATDEYYSLSKASNYIRTDRIEKNLYWVSPTEYGDIEITVNLSKPEKDPKAIAAEKNMKKSDYPKCLLCVENVGYAGRVNHPARQNHRVIPIELSNEQWFFQYSPYVYYNEHCIIFSETHRPMKIDKKTFVGLLDFVEQVPHYFLGSNAELPIVGGSILSHEHFQGGHHRFPMEKALVERAFTYKNYPGVKIGIVKWPMSVIRIAGKSKYDLAEVAGYILEQWRKYSDNTADVLAFSEENGRSVPHNTITPIARENQDQEFELDLVLRNNRISEEYPDGIFHPHKEFHHIKKENIGLIEVMGLAVLPGRLDEEMKEIESILTGNREFDEKEVKNDEGLAKHFPWIKKMVSEYGTNNEKTEATKILRIEIGKIFACILENAGVFKRNKNGTDSFIRFMDHLGFKAN